MHAPNYGTASQPLVLVLGSSNLGSDAAAVSLPGALAPSREANCTPMATLARVGGLFPRAFLLSKVSNGG
jgi:hypothetical protein